MSLSLNYIIICLVGKETVKDVVGYAVVAVFSALQCFVSSCGATVALNVDYLLKELPTTVDPPIPPPSRLTKKRRYSETGGERSHI